MGVAPTGSRGHATALSVHARSVDFSCGPKQAAPLVTHPSVTNVHHLGGRAVDRPVESTGDDFDAWYRATWPRLVGFLIVQTGSRDEAEDIAAEAVVRAAERWDTVEIDSVTSWTFAVALNHLRRTRRRSTLERRLLKRTTPGPATIEPRDPDLVTALRLLPRRQRLAVTLRYIGDLSQAEVATAMGIAPGTAAALLNHARTNLRTALSEEEDHG